MDERTGSESLKREEELDRKFLTSGQEKVKLEIALMRYFELAKDKNKDSLMEIINKFRPLIKKQAYALNYEDAENDLIVDMIELIYNIPY